MRVPFEFARRQMLRRQLERRGIFSRPVLTAMGQVPRERFVGAGLQDEAYADKALHIDCGQTISQPYIVALMTQTLQLTGREKVLEVGTGSGYQTAVLAELAAEVVSIERHPDLSRRAGEILAELGYRNIALVVGDGTLGWPAAAPFDRILITAAGARMPPALFAQLAEGGLLVMPIGDRANQTLRAIRKVAGQPQESDLSPCRFVPLIGEQGWPEEEV